MAKKKTSVMLPGSVSDLADLVRSVQRGGGDTNKKTKKTEEKPIEKKEEKVEEKTAEVEQEEVNEPAASPQQSEKEEVKRKPGRPAKTYEGQTPTQKAERDYNIIIDKGADSWDLFLALARDYKTRDSRLATIYIDGDLKKILDRLRTASSVELPTAAILSGIVARFIFEHKDDINNAIFGDRLL